MNQEADFKHKNELERLENEYSSFDDYQYCFMETVEEETREIAAEYYENLSAIKQTLINSIIIALYHLYEQQIMLFLQLKIAPYMENLEEPEKYKKKDLLKRLQELGIDISALPAWKEIVELRLLANTIKHAEGDSAFKLQEIRPDFFYGPIRKKVWMKISLKMIFGTNL